MIKKHIPIALITVILAVLALAGYLRPTRAHEMPVRILLSNTGGNVIFTHLKHHRDYQIPCEECHHEAKGAVVKNATDYVPCGACHPVAFNQDYVRDHINSFPDEKYCVECHHAEFGELLFDHKAHMEEYVDGDCQACHHDESVSPKPQRCKNCHTLAGTKDLISFRDAAHDRCIVCHEDMFERSNVQACAPCHQLKNMSDYSGPYTPCKQCHDAKGKDLMLLTRTNAFHDQCMDCHEKREKGPYGDKDCYKCHKK